MYCNTCFVSLRPGEGAVAISCGHLACRQCFERSIVPARRCGVCTKSTDDADMAWREIVIPSGINGPGDLLQLAGHDVDTCMSLSFAAIQFRCRQDDLYAKLRYDKLSQKLQATEAHYKKKIGIMNQGYEDLRVQVDALRREKRDGGGHPRAAGQIRPEGEGGDEPPGGQPGTWGISRPASRQPAAVAATDGTGPRAAQQQPQQSEHEPDAAIQVPTSHGADPCLRQRARSTRSAAVRVALCVDAGT